MTGVTHCRGRGGRAELWGPGTGPDQLPAEDVTSPSAILNFTFPFPSFEIRHRAYFANEVVAARTKPKASGTVGSRVRL